jgi:glycosyltransferase involved in cell wall biosynthesis
MNTPAPAVSVMMPVYNAERYVAQAVESILAQTFTNFEFLIVDDGSTDRSREILEEYARRDGRILLISRGNTGYLAWMPTT